MLSSYKRFFTLVKDTENVEVLYNYFNTSVTAPVDTSDLLRWQWVQCISAFDKLIHDLVRVGMLEIFMGKRLRTPKYSTFQIDIQTYVDMADNINAVSILEQKIILKHGFLAFQEPGKVADALSYIWNENDKWGRISGLMALNRNDCVTYLKNIVIRRNQIVHEGDYTDIYSKRQDIDPEDVIDIRNYILKLGKAIYDCVSLEKKGS
ncbi:HEPN domain-containing protein [Otoolea muris]|uniref:HEPN domain-containing protein n=1 Tax=Otoolea muris TaxID=2941515 RepID=UPI00203C3B88|nr:HEPN domain-containing protein [Otoolea muris]